MDYYNVTSAGAVMKARLADSVATNPELVNGDKEITFRATESALYLIVLGIPDSGVAPKEVRSSRDSYLFISPPDFSLTE